MKSIKKLNKDILLSKWIINFPENITNANFLITAKVNKNNGDKFNIELKNGDSINNFKITTQDKNSNFYTNNNVIKLHEKIDNNECVTISGELFYNQSGYPTIKGSVITENKKYTTFFFG